MSKNDKMMIDECKNKIVESFKKEFGFAPAKKNIIPLESADNSIIIDFMGFAVNGVGYSWNFFNGVVKNDAYDMA